MELTTLFLLAVGLSMDAFAVSISDGLTYRDMGKKQAFAVSGAFGLFQALMPVAGFLSGQLFINLISSLDHWVALILLTLIGGNMIREAIGELRHPETVVQQKSLTGKAILLQAVATSIDALAVGISFAALKVNIFTASSFIGLITFLLCLAGSFLGRRFGGVLKEKAEIFGGLILIAIGIKIFAEHMFF